MSATASSGLSERLEQKGRLVVGARAQGRVRRNGGIGFDGAFGLANARVDFAQRRPCQRVVGRHVHGQPQEDERVERIGLLSAGRAEPVQRFGGAGHRVGRERRKQLALVQFAQRRSHKRVARKLLVEGLIDLPCLIVLAGARQEATPGVDRAHDARIGLMQRAQALAGLVRIAARFGDECGVIIAVARKPLVGDAVEKFEGLVRAAVGKPAPGGERDCGQLQRTGGRAREITARLVAASQAHGAHADDEARERVAWLPDENAIGQRDALVDVAARQRGRERAAQQFRVAGIAAQGFAHERGFCARVLRALGKARRQVIAGKARRGLGPRRQRHARRPTNGPEAEKPGKDGRRRNPSRSLRPTSTLAAFRKRYPPPGGGRD